MKRLRFKITNYFLKRKIARLNRDLDRLAFNRERFVSCSFTRHGRIKQ